MSTRYHSLEECGSYDAVRRLFVHRTGALTIKNPSTTVHRVAGQR